MSSQLERDTSSSFSSTSSSSPDGWLSPKSPNPLAFCSCPSSAPNSKGFPLCLYPFYPSYPLLSSPCLLSCGALPSVQCSPVFILPQDTSHPTILVPNVLRSVSDLKDCSASGDTLFPHLWATQTSHPAQSSKAKHAGPGMAKTFSSWSECAGKRCPAKQNSPRSQVAASVLPYPLKKENGRIRYECNECGKSFGQLSNLKVSASPTAPPESSVLLLHPSLLLERTRALGQPALGGDLGSHIWFLSITPIETNPLYPCKFDSFKFKMRKQVSWRFGHSWFDGMVEISFDFSFSTSNSKLFLEQ